MQEFYHRSAAVSILWTTSILLFGCVETSVQAPIQEHGQIDPTCSRSSKPIGLPATPPPAMAMLPIQDQQLLDYQSDTSRAVIKLVSTIENGPTFSYDAVTPNFDGEGLSLDLIQFNLGGDAQLVFRGIDEEVFTTTMPTWGKTFYAAVHTTDAKRAIGLIVEMQKKVGGRWVVDPVAKSELQAFLNSQASMVAQDSRVAQQFAHALARAKQWAADIGEAKPSAREIATFFDNQVFSGGALDGVWVGQAKAFRSKFADDARMVRFASQWLESCPSTGAGFLYGAEEGRNDAHVWERKITSANSLSESQALLFAFGFVRALAAVGPSDDPSQSGIFKAQVLSRRGMIATSLGTANGVAWPGGRLDN